MNKHNLCVLTLSISLLAPLAFGQAGSGIKTKDVVTSPYIRTFMQHDSNATLARENEENDTRYGAEYGVNISRSGSSVKIDASLFGFSEVYDKQSDLDHNDWGQTLGLQYQSTIFTANLKESYRQIEDIDYVAADIAKVNDFDLSGDLNFRISDRSNIKTDYKYRNKGYESDNYFDWDRHILSGQGDYTLTDLSRIFAKSSIGQIAGDGNINDALYYDALVGIQSLQTTKLSFSLAAGVLGISETDTDFSDIAYEGTLEWRATDRVHVNARGGREVQPTIFEENNYQLISSVDIDIVWNTTEAVSLSALTAFKNIDTRLPVDGKNKTEDVLVAQLRADYATPQKWLKVYALSSYSTQDSSIEGNDYDKIQFEGGITVQY